MKKSISFLLLSSAIIQIAIVQNVGIGTTSPQAKLHIKGNANISQLIVEASSTQSSSHPLIRLRDASGNQLVDIHSDNPQNLFVGALAGIVNNAGSGGLGNTFIGAQAGFNNSTGYSLTALGSSALSRNTTGGENTAIGAIALYYNTTGLNNTAVGRGSLYQNNANDNTAVGFRTLFSNTSGFFNTATGSQALATNINGSYNTANGYKALYNNTTGDDNTANGNNALYNNTTGYANTANGSLVLDENTTGIQNTATGAYALHSNSSGSFNTATGVFGLNRNETGGLNTANGYQALVNNTIGGLNTADGVYAMKSNTAGGYNTASGVNAMYSNTVGLNNTAIGFQALYNNVGGSNNIAIGTNAGPAPGSPNITNTIGIGNNDYQNTANNQVIIGNLSTTYYAIHGSWTTFSDARIKTGIAEEVKGLDFINRLRPVTYFKNIEAITTLTGNKETADFEGKYDIEKIKFSGFVAQEVEQAAKESGYDFSGLHTPQSKNDLYALSYETFVVPLVKAVQEQQEIIETLKKGMAEMKLEIKSLKENH